MSKISVNTDEWKVKACAPHNIPTIEGFKNKFRYPLLPNRYTVYFKGKTNVSTNYFNQSVMANGIPNTQLECKVSSISLPNYQFDNEEVYLGGSTVSVPTGLTKGNLDITILNQGIEYAVIFGWLRRIYNASNRHYAYFDDVAINLYVTQYATDGTYVMEHHYYDCVPYSTQLSQLSYDSANSAYTFSISLNYFSYECVYNNNIDVKLSNDEIRNVRLGGKTGYKNTVTYYEGDKQMEINNDIAQGN